MTNIKDLMKIVMNLLLIISLFLPLVASSQDIKPEDITSARKIRRAELSDPIRPEWHLTIAEGKAMPFDPNGAIFKDGVYHLCLLYTSPSPRD